MAKNILKFKYN